MQILLCTERAILAVFDNVFFKHLSVNDFFTFALLFRQKPRHEIRHGLIFVHGKLRNFDAKHHNCMQDLACIGVRTHRPKTHTPWSSISRGTRCVPLLRSSAIEHAAAQFGDMEIV